MAGIAVRISLPRRTPASPRLRTARSTAPRDAPGRLWRVSAVIFHRPQRPSGARLGVALAIGREGQLPDTPLHGRIGDCASRDLLIRPGPGTVGFRCDLQTLSGKDLTDRLDGGALASELLDECQISSCGGRVPPRRKSRPCVGSHWSLSTVDFPCAGA